MNYIVFDLEFNQDPESFLDLRQLEHSSTSKTKYPFEIIQFGAVKLDMDFNALETFNRLVKPSIYSRISPYVTELTGITSESLKSEAPFEQVLKEFANFSKKEESIFCVWGMTDLKELYRNIKYFNLEEILLPKKYINIQPHTSVYLGMSKKKLLRLSYCVEALGIDIKKPFHHALNDALYTAEVFKKIYHPSIQPRSYDPSKSTRIIRSKKMVLDYPKIIAQFEKMFSREMTKEDQEIIRLAYHMGKTGQFLIESEKNKTSQT